MKATRLKRGWRLALSDSEMEVLCEAVSHLQSDWANDADYGHMDPPVKVAFRKSFLSLSWPENIDDRRAP